jgi:hypothetical protein
VSVIRPRYGSFNRSAAIIHLVDYYESSGAPLGHYVDVLHEKRLKQRWKYGQHWFPHDVKARELNTAMSRVETLRSLGVEPEVVPAHHKQDSVNAVRRILDRTWIDPNRCERGLDCLKNYRYEWKDKQRIWTAYPRFMTGHHTVATRWPRLQRALRIQALRTVRSAEIGATAASQLPRTGRHEQRYCLMSRL